jgi:predicted ArsR family transcriptional regulator
VRSTGPDTGDDTAAEAEPGDEQGRPTALSLLKALGDNTRYAIYLELARSPVPLSTSDIADTLELHPNTVRPHLERMREVGLVDYETYSQGVGRPLHRYHLSSGAPSLGLEPPTFPLLARMLCQLAARAGVSADDAADIGREQGRVDGDAQRRRGLECVEALLERLAVLGFDPEPVADGLGTTIAFAHCPFADLAREHPEVVCHLHRGLVEGIAAAFADHDVAAFRTFTDRNACQVDLLPVAVT